jgi:rhodanese-related sulfurtransferase
MKFLMDNWMLILVALSSGAMLLFPAAGRGMRGGALTPSGAVQLINREKAVVVDVCESEEYAAGHITNARHVPLGQLEQRLPEVVKNKALPVILVCQTGARAQRAVNIAQKLGYPQAQALGGGLRAWKEANLPLDKS